MGFSAIASRLHLTKSHSSSKSQQTRASDPQQRLMQFEHIKQLAPALYGQVWLCHDTSSSSRGHRRCVAVKTVNLLAASRQQTVRGGVHVREDVHKERRVHATLRKHIAAAGAVATAGSSNVLLVQEELESRGVLYMVFDFCAAGDLLEVVRRSPRRRLDERHARSCLRDVARGLQFLHRAGYAHRDISLENVLMTATGECKLSDFGLACDISAGRGRRSRERVGKQWYMAPEVYACNGYDSDSDSDPTEADCDGEGYDPVLADMWSLGVLFVIMITGAPLLSAAAPLMDRRFQSMLEGGPEALFARNVIRNELVSADARDLICCMLQVSPTKRISLDALLQHAFFQNDQ